MCRISLVSARTCRAHKEYTHESLLQSARVVDDTQSHTALAGARCHDREQELCLMDLEHGWRASSLARRMKKSGLRPGTLRQQSLDTRTITMTAMVG
jgi:hypothetical protein